MKKLSLVLMCLMSLFFILMSFNLQADDASTGTDKNPSQMTCRCGAVYGKGCKADNHGAVCAPTGTGKCWEYDKNCSE